MVKHPFYIGLLAVLIPLLGQSQSRDWTNYASRKLKYPDAKYFKGFTSRYLNKKEDYSALPEKLKNRAQALLSENINIRIKTEITNSMANVNAVSVEDFRRVSTSFSQIKLPGIETDFYINSKGEEAFAFAWVEKQKVVAYYKQRLEQEYTILDTKLQFALQFAKQKEVAKALGIRNELFVTIRTIEDAQAVLLSCGITNLEDLRIKQLQEYKNKISSQLELAGTEAQLDLNTLASLLVRSLSLQKVNKKLPIKLGEISYRDSEMSSEFSLRLKSILATEFIGLGYQILAASQPVSLTEASDVQVLNGVYWDNKDQHIQVILNVYNSVQQKKYLIASAEAWTSTEELNNAQVSHIPTNFKDAITAQEIFQKGEITNTGIEVEIWTNKGIDGPIFVEGDRLSLSVKVNRPGYLRLLNYWADGTKLLLADNYYIDVDKVNKIFPLPFEWKTACPCGIEFLQAIVQTAPFDPLEIKPMGGFKVVVGDLEKVVEKSRSFRGFLDAKEAYMGEKRLTLTTLK